ncbi:sugar phosphate nucleotidyltransferase [Chitinivorax sp. B]|uniref:sugar phosphate nucleotidyltransferase n=1 Tax=Chitinivorax sp. B TaxID=2502235 RepID=UPI0010F728DC|nr:sugar phosphate nucleotidyltransferase [Chitinivorax sp. B]
MQIQTAIILAGGLGTRLRSAVPDLPKPMAPINGRPFLEQQMDYWIGQGIDQFILSVGYRREAIMDHFGQHYRNAPIQYAIEDIPLGTGGGVLLALGKLASLQPCLLLNGDTYFEVALDQLTAFHRHRQADLSFSLFRANEADRYMGMTIAEDGEVLALKSGKSAVGSFANGGVYVLNPSGLMQGCFQAGIKLSFEDDLLPALQRQGARLFGMVCDGRFVDIGLPADYARAADMIS